MKKEEMLKTIYDRVSDKTPTFGCLFRSTYWKKEGSLFAICDWREHMSSSSHPFGRFRPEESKPKKGDYEISTSDMRMGDFVFARVGYKEIIQVTPLETSNPQWEDFLKTVTIVGHPVMLGDILDWIDNQKRDLDLYYCQDCESMQVMKVVSEDGHRECKKCGEVFSIYDGFSDLESMLLGKREYPRKTIDEQGDEVIAYVHSLVVRTDTSN